MTTRYSLPRRILIVALDNLGDLVFASALASPLYDAFPGAPIDVWSKAYTADVARLIPHVGDVIGSDTPWAMAPHLARRARPQLRPLLGAVARIRRRRYDVALITGAPWRTAALVAMSGIPMRVGLARRHNQRFLTHALPPENIDEPVLREQARLLEPLGVRSPSPRYQLDASRLGDRRARLGVLLPERFIAIHPFAGARERCVELVEWTQAAFAFESRGVPTLWVGMPHELDELRRSVTHPRGFYSDQIGQGSLADVAAAISIATAFIGHDSGPLHVAGAFGVPVVGVFAPGQPKRTFPQGVGPSRMIARSSPQEISARLLMHEAEQLEIFSSA